jgi:hypothetical protein
MEISGENISPSIGVSVGVLQRRYSPVLFGLALAFCFKRTSGAVLTLVQRPSSLVERADITNIIA